MKEIWKSIPEYKGLYEVSNMGRVRKACSNGGWKKFHILKPRFGYNRRYLVVRLHKNKLIKEYAVHGLVLLAFRGLCPKGMEGSHLNDVKLDNRLKNLRWGTHKQNTTDAIRNGIGGFFRKGHKDSLETRKRKSIAQKKRYV